jgi:hypothetical protein
MNNFFFDLGPLCELIEIAKSRNTGQIMDLEYVGVDSNVAKSVVNFIVVELMDETKTRLLASNGMLYLFIETISNKKE